MDQMGKLKFEPGLNPVKPIIDANINLYSAQAESKAITIINAITENLIAYFDKGMIDIVIRNFISNAVKFTPKGGEVIINTKKEGGFLKVEVSDTGIGIDEDVVNSLFGKGIKSKYLGQGTENEKGAGIGLMLCEEFVELNGGTIGVVSKKNIGSVFFFTLPVE
jgi:signal transduction histidine kinase